MLFWLFWCIRVHNEYVRSLTRPDLEAESQFFSARSDGLETLIPKVGAGARRAFDSVILDSQAEVIGSRQPRLIQNRVAHNAAEK